MLNFTFKKKNEKLRDVDETVQNEVEMKLRHVKSTLLKASTELCGTERVGCEREKWQHGMKIYRNWLMRKRIFGKRS